MLTQLQKDSIIITKLICLLAEIYQLFVMHHDFAHNNLSVVASYSRKANRFNNIEKFFLAFLFLLLLCIYD